MELSPTNKEGLNTRATQAMISAVADSCSVRLDKVNGKVYKFHALVFNPDSQGNNKEAYLSREKSCKTEPISQEPVTRGILSQQPKTEWKCAYNELLSSSKGLQQKDDLLSGPTRKRSKTSQDLSNGERQRVRFKAETADSGAETSTCPTCLQVIAKESNDFDCLMEKTKEELVSMIINLNTSLQNGNRRRKNGYSPTDNDIARL